MAKDQTRNIETFKIGGTRLNEFEFHKHQRQMGERFDRRSRDAGAHSTPLTRAEQIAALTERARQKARRQKKKKTH